MAQIFHRSTNFIARFSVFSFIFIMGFAVLAVLHAARSSYMTRRHITREQPVLFSNAGYLDPVRESYRTDTSIEWVKVHRLADFVYFNHSIHVNKGVGCTTCHGPIDQMPLVFQASTLLMQWCVDCHRNPAPNLRSMDKVFAMDWKPGADQEELGEKFMKERKIRTAAELTSCSTCHR